MSAGARQTHVGGSCGCCKAVEVVRPEAPAPHRSRKDTKRWCKGKVGREHAYRWILSPIRFGTQPPSWWEELCETCGRKARWCTRGFKECICGHHR